MRPVVEKMLNVTVTLACPLLVDPCVGALSPEGEAEQVSRAIVTARSTSLQLRLVEDHRARLPTAIPMATSL